MSHELRTPLTAVIGFGQLLQMEELSEANQDSVDHIVRAGRHLLDLINEVLDIARIETGDLSLSVEPIEVHEIVDETLSLMRPYAAEHQVTIAIEGTDHQLRAMADRQRLKQVLLNLFSNAIKYNRVGGTVRVGWTRNGERVHIDVHDTGLGISEEGKGRIFVPFDRVDAVHSGIEGTGVGLSLSKGLMEAMDGAIAFESTAGVGSTFWLDLPGSADVVAAPTDGAQALPVGERAGSEATVLYVEDNLANVRVMERLFARRREALTVAMQGSRCLDLARQLRPDLILLDLHLPDLDGEEVLRLLKADPTTSDIRVIILSADTSPRRVARLRELGAADYLAKPLELDRLVSALDQLAEAGP
jgi:CheY-like chemotaxis protein